jgi:hypothetical protein
MSEQWLVWSVICLFLLFVGIGFIIFVMWKSPYR